MPNARGPCFSICPRNLPATKSNASSQLAGRWPRESRISGDVSLPVVIVDILKLPPERVAESIGRKSKTRGLHRGAQRNERLPQHIDGSEKHRATTTELLQIGQACVGSSSHRLSRVLAHACIADCRR